MEDKRKLYLEQCRDAIEKVKTDTWSVEEAAERLVSLLLQNEELLRHLEIQGIFNTLHEAEITREVSYAQKIGSWDKDMADRIKSEEWERVVAAIEYAEQVK